MTNYKNLPIDELKYDLLVKAIEKYSCKPLSELPSDLRERVVGAFTGPSWDILNERGRIEFALQFDFNRDPSQREKREKFFKLGLRKWEIKQELECRKKPEQKSLEEEARKRIVASLESERADIQHELDDLYSALNSPLPNWTLKNPKRLSGYRCALLSVLQSAHELGYPVPTAQDVISKWHQTKPHGIKANDNTFTYLDSEGKWKTVDLEALKKAIDRLVDRTADKT